MQQTITLILLVHQHLSMSELTIFLAEAPNAKKEFLACTEPLSSLHQVNDDLPVEITIDRYTRESWCRSSNSTSDHWQGLWLKSIDKRGRIPGFVKFLKGRAKAAYGKFESPQPDEVTGEERRGLLLVPFEQPPFPSKELLAEAGVSSVNDLIYVKFCFDERNIFKDSLRQTKTKDSKSTTNQQDVLQSRNHNSYVRSKTSSSNQSKAGLLGSILGAQERTNRNLEAVSVKRISESKTLSTDTQNDAKIESNEYERGQLTPVLTTSNQVISNFRSRIESKLLNFASSSQTEFKVLINLANEISLLQSLDEKAKISMEVLKYIVYEQVEEIGEDQWVAAKEASEFMDEATIAIYKAGHAPEEILEELNKGEIPDEARRQQRAIRDALNKEEKRKAKIVEELNVKKAVEESNEIKRLNFVKRDRRTIEEIQRDMMSSSKRARSS